MDRRFTNAEVAAQFRLLADLSEINGESVFRTSAFRRAAESIVALPESIIAVRERNALRTIPGVGPGIEKDLIDLLATGEMPPLKALAETIPLGVAELLAVPDIGPKRARSLYEHLGIESLAALRVAAGTGRLSELPGLGAKGAQRIIDGLKAMHSADDRMTLPAARALGVELIARLRAADPTVVEAELAGSARRMQETVGDLDIVAASESPETVVEAFATLPSVTRVEMRGANRCRVNLENGVAADLRVLPPQHWGSLLHHFTGGKSHNVHLREVAIAAGAHISVYGFTRGDELIPCATEAGVYALLGMQFIPPQMREEIGEIDLALKHELPSIVQPEDLKGDLHAHTTWSDGTASVLEMGIAAQARGYAYLCITDHTKSLAIANGLDADRLLAQRAEIEAANAELAPFRILQGAEVEVLSDGSLDLDDEVLQRLDIVIASVHSGTRRGKEAVTNRALAAVRHPLVNILAHPTGRILGGRGAGDLDVAAILPVAAEYGTILEINGSRFDFNETHAREAIAAGCFLSVDSDAHSTGGLGEIDYAVGIAQRAWICPEKVVNCLPLEELLEAIARKRKGG